MLRSIKDSFLSKVNFTDSELDLIVGKLKTREIPRKKFLLFSGSACDFIAYIVSGCMRSYSILADGQEKTLQLATENHWISDLGAFLTGDPAYLIIESIESTKVQLLYRNDLEELLKAVPSLEKYFRILYQEAYVNLQERLHSFVMLNARDRYLSLMKKHPEILQRVPLVHLASYLGVSPETISRVRKEIS